MDAEISLIQNQYSDSKLNPQIDTEPILIGIESSNSPII